MIYKYLETQHTKRYGKKQREKKTEIQLDWLQSELLFRFEEFAIIMKFLFLVRCLKPSHQKEK